MKLNTLHIERAAYAPYGDLISADAKADFVLTNMGTARRFNRLCDMQNLRGESAALNVCVFRCEPYSDSPISIGLLERHRHSTQIFVPFSGSDRYLAVVALGGDSPDPATLRAFLVTGGRGISYHPGVWHHPMIVIDKLLDFACFVWEAGTPEDTQTVPLGSPVMITVCP